MVRMGGHLCHLCCVSALCTLHPSSFLGWFQYSSPITTRVMNKNGVILEMRGGGWLPVTMSRFDVTPGFFFWLMVTVLTGSNSDSD